AKVRESVSARIIRYPANRPRNRGIDGKRTIRQFPPPRAFPSPASKESAGGLETTRPRAGVRESGANSEWVRDWIAQARAPPDRVVGPVPLPPGRIRPATEGTRPPARASARRTARGG